MKQTDATTSVDKKKKELERVYKIRIMTRTDVFEYIKMFYNQIMCSSYLDGMSTEVASKMRLLLNRGSYEQFNIKIEVS